jgi:beta-mannosidase
MYETLIRSGEIPDPYVGENEWEATRLSDEDTVFERAVSLAEPPREGEKTLLRFAGLDTLAEVYWDGELLGKADNMHRTWEFSLDGRDGAGEHRLRILFRSPSVYVTEAQKKRPL